MRLEDGKHQKPGYTGFLVMECEACGRLHPFFSRYPVRRYECACGHRTELGPLTLLFFQHECGERILYRTNCTAEHVTLPCPCCGAPVEMELNRRVRRRKGGRFTAYQVMR